MSLACLLIVGLPFNIEVRTRPVVLSIAVMTLTARVPFVSVLTLLLPSVTLGFTRLIIVFILIVVGLLIGFVSNVSIVTILLLIVSA